MRVHACKFGKQYVRRRKFSFRKTKLNCIEQKTLPKKHD